jgi:hypothetical protein
MVAVNYDPEMTMREARDRYFLANGFGADGGYGDAWVDFKLGPVPFPFPNVPSRVRALQFHDLHHILTGYDTSTTGEFEISAWELGAGCKDYAAAWFLNLGGLAGGLAVSPKKTFRAFVRGRRTESLYDRPLDAMLERTVGDMRKETRADAREPEATLLDGVLFAASAAAGTVVGLSFLAVGAVLAPIALAAGLVRKAAPAPR